MRFFFTFVFELLTNKSKNYILEIPNMSLNCWYLRCWQICYFFIFEFVDADECTLGTANCPSNSLCVNRDQGFDCDCVSGYTKVADTCQGKPLVFFLLGWDEGHVNISTTYIQNANNQWYLGFPWNPWFMMLGVL